jgi:D-alanyl-D-alanine carboxypeptidase
MRSDIRAYLEGQVSASRLPGLQYVAVDAQRELVAVAAGQSDLQLGRPMTLETTLMAYSMSKTVTAIAVLQLVGDGRISLDGPVADYLRESPYGNRVTVRQLMAHTGGLPNPMPLRWVHPIGEHAAFNERNALADVWRAHPKRVHAPGARYAYSNIGYWMLGALVERVSGVAFTEFVASRIVAPLGLTREELGYEIVEPTRGATGYLERRSWANLLGRWLLDPALLGEPYGRWRTIGAHYPNGPAFGGLVGTARAFARLLQDQLRPHSVLLGDDMRGLLYQQQSTATGVLVPMTLGWHVGVHDHTTFYYKEGGGGGFHALMRLAPTRGIGSVLMTNATTFDVTTCLGATDAILFSEAASTSPAREGLGGMVH